MKILNRGQLTNRSTADSEGAKKMWSIYTKEVNKYDENVTTAQRDDANSVLVFVSHKFPTLASVAVRGALTVFEDRSLLRSRCRFRTRRLQEAVPRP
jgi:hypothetical protein